MDDLPLAARARAAGDRNRLAALVASGIVRLRGDARPDDPFVIDIQRRARAHRAPVQAPRGMDTIRPNAKRAKAKRRR